MCFFGGTFFCPTSGLGDCGDPEELIGGGFQIIKTSHDSGTPKSSFLEGKWDPENFREI